jgi:hypothetical protein
MRASLNNCTEFEAGSDRRFAGRNAVNCRLSRYLSGTYLEGV